MFFCLSHSFTCTVTSPAFFPHKKRTKTCLHQLQADDSILSFGPNADVKLYRGKGNNNQGTYLCNIINLRKLKMQKGRTVCHNNNRCANIEQIQLCLFCQIFYKYCNPGRWPLHRSPRGNLQRISQEFHQCTNGYSHRLYH